MNREDYVLRDNQGSFTYKFVIIGLIGVRVRQERRKKDKCEAAVCLFGLIFSTKRLRILPYGDS